MANTYTAYIQISGTQGQLSDEQVTKLKSYLPTELRSKVITAIQWELVKGSALNSCYPGSEAGIGIRYMVDATTLRTYTYWGGGTSPSW